MDKERKILEQDLSQEGPRPGSVFIIKLLFDEFLPLPSRKEFHSVFKKHLGEGGCPEMDGGNLHYAAESYAKELDGKMMPPLLMVMEATAITQPVLDDFDRTQTWDCPNAEEVLAACKYQIVAFDMMGFLLDYKERAELLVHFTEALLELFPGAVALLFETSKKLFARESIVNLNIPLSRKFIYYAVNVRFFNIEGKNEMLVDSLGMSTLELPDVQYHFKGLDPNAVVNHAYNILSYTYDENAPFEDGDVVDGLVDGVMSREVMWKVRYEDSLIQPLRPVLDVHTGEHAAGSR